jgi:drug/metabolite transporter (DMT)-like permease
VGYILVYLGAVLWPRIGEAFTLEKTAGIVLIMLGVALVATPTKANNHE